jgi:hypothetical protein
MKKSRLAREGGVRGGAEYSLGMHVSRRRAGIREKEGGWGMRGRSLASGTGMRASQLFNCDRLRASSTPLSGVQGCTPETIR